MTVIVARHDQISCRSDSLDSLSLLVIHPHSTSRLRVGQVDRLDRVCVQESLLQNASRFPKPVSLLLVLDALGNQIDLHTSGDGNLTAHQSLGAFVS